MVPEPERLIRWIGFGAQAAAIGALVLGALSVADPRRSIGLYQWIMARFNWRVSPIDEPREMRTTRWLGWALVALSLALMWTLWGATAMANDTTPSNGTATFAGGCFWCMQPAFDATPGVVSTRVGYTGGRTPNPTYEEVSSGATGHAEAIEVIYDPAKVTYAQLLDVFWRHINPTTVNGQFADHGTQYRTAVFYHDEEQRRLAEASKERLAKSGKFDKPIVTEITRAAAFYPAEEYHQQYYRKQAAHYTAYKIGSGREEYLKNIWGQ